MRVLCREVRQPRISVVAEKNIRRLERRVRNRVRVQIGEAFADRAEQLEHCRFIDLLAARLQLGKILPVDVFVRVKDAPICFACFVNCED